MKAIKKLAKDFINTHFDEFDLKKCDLEGYTKSKVIKEINREYWFACWIVTEVMSWGLQENYLKPYVVEHEGDFLVIKVDDMYFKLNYETYCFDETEAKTKVISYFE